MLISAPILLLAKVTLVLVLALLAAVALRRAPATARHRLWLGTLVAMLVMPALGLWAPLRVAVLPPAAVSTTNAGRARVPADAADAAAPAAMPASDATAPSVRANDPAPLPATHATHAWLVAPSPATLAIVIWAVVALAILAVLARAELAVRGIVRRATPLTSSTWPSMLYEVADRLGLDEPPALAHSPEIGMPFAWGMRRPVVVLPADCDGWTDDRRRAVLLHELAHVRRRDLVGHALSRLASALWWFHPLVWTAARRLRVESERACDDLALVHGTVPSDYAEHLLDIVTSVRGTRMPVAALAMARPTEFEGRMLAILDPACPRTEQRRLRAAVSTASLTLLALALGAASPARRAPSTSPAHRSIVMARLDTASSSRSVEPMAPSASAHAPSHATPNLDASHVAVSHAAMLQSPMPPQSSTSSTSSAPNAPTDTTPATTRATLLARVLRTDTSARIRRVAAWGLADFAEQPAASAALVSALRGDRSADVREMAAWALAEAREGGDAEQALVASLAHDPDPSVRATSAWALGSVGDAKAVSTLTAALSDTSAKVRERAVWAIGNAGVDQAPKEIVALLGDRSPRVRELTAWALYEIGDASAIPALERALHAETDPKLQVAYVRALAATGDKSVDALSALVQSPDARIRDVAVRALAGGNARGPWPWPWPEPRPYP